MIVRYAGLFCNRWKGQYLSQARIALNQFEPEASDKNIQLSWTERQKEYTGVDPATHIHKIFGCIEGKAKHVCSICRVINRCIFRDLVTMACATGGICEDCWKKHQAGNRVVND